MSNTAHSIYKLDEKVCEMVVSGVMSDINQFCKFKWFEWVMFHDNMTPYPDALFRLGKYLGLSIDIGPVMVKIIEENGQGFHQSMYQALTQEE